MNQQHNGNAADEDERRQEIAELVQSPGSSVVATIEKAQLDQLIVTARQYPRNVSYSMKMIVEMARLDEEAARECVYSLPRGGKAIIGPSIRFAEIVKQCWGNCSAIAYVTEYDRKEGWIEAEGRFLDFQTMAETKGRVRRRIVDRHGRIYNDDMIIVTGNAACSIAMRNAILGGVPRPAWRQGYEGAFGIAIEHKGKTFAEARDDALKAFAQYGVTGEQVMGSLGVKSIKDLLPEHLISMRGMWAALKNGEETVDSLFDPRRGRPFESVKDPLSDSAPAADAGHGDEEQPGPDETADEAQAETPAEEETAKPAEPAKADKPAAKAAEKEDAPPKPHDDASYEVWATHWIAKATSASMVTDRWKREKPMRGECDVAIDGEIFNRLVAQRDKREAELKAAAKK